MYDFQFMLIIRDNRLYALFPNGKLRPCIFDKDKEILYSVKNTSQKISSCNQKIGFENIKNHKADVMYMSNKDPYNKVMLFKYVNREIGEKKRKSYIEQYNSVYKFDTKITLKLKQNDIEKIRNSAFSQIFIDCIMELRDTTFENVAIGKEFMDTMFKYSVRLAQEFRFNNDYLVEDETDTDEKDTEEKREIDEEFYKFVNEYDYSEIIEENIEAIQNKEKSFIIILKGITYCIYKKLELKMELNERVYKDATSVALSEYYIKEKEKE